MATSARPLSPTRSISKVDKVDETMEMNVAELPIGGEGSSSAVHHEPSVSRPPIDFSSIGALFKSTSNRLASIFTKRFLICLVAGQFVSVCITATSVISTELAMRGFNMPTTQSFFVYFGLCVIYTPYTIYQYGFNGWCKMLYKDGWKYFILAAADVEANFLVVLAYQYTNLLSCMLLDAWATPVCMFLVWLYMRPKFHWTQLLGVGVCMFGLGLLVVSDVINNGGDAGQSLIKGDMFMLAGATLYGFSNATEEFFVRKSPLYEVIGQLGMWGVIINGIQAAALEHEHWVQTEWTPAIIGFLFVFTFAMLSLYTIAPILYRMASSTYYNLSILSSDFFGLCFGLGLYQLNPYWLYFVAFAVIIVGLVLYFWNVAPEEGKIDPQAPSYVEQRHATKAVAGNV